MIMSRTYTNGGYTVTINDDRSIRVKPGDWISKYTTAIYGEPRKYWDRFKRKDKAGRFIDLADPNKIIAGEVLYHPDALPGEPPGRRPTYPGVPSAPSPTPVVPPPAGGIDVNRILDFFRFLKRWMCPVTDWKFMGSAGIDLSVSAFAAHYTEIQAQRRIPNPPPPTKFKCVGAGVGIGPEDIFGSISISPPDFPGPGTVWKFPSAGQSLSADEITGNYVLLDFSCGLGLGFSVGLMLIGMNTPWRFLGDIYRYFHGTGDMFWVTPGFNGIIWMLGTSWTTPNFGVSAKVGVMYQ
jgi:hypothetical protein